MLNITEKFQATQVKSLDLERFYDTNLLQNNSIPLNSWEKRTIFKRELAKLRSKISLAVFIVGTYLIDNCNNETMKAYHSIERICKDTHLPRRTVDFALRRLTNIEFIKRRQQSKRNGQWSTCETWLNCSLLTVRNLGCAHTTIIREEVSINTTENEILKFSRPGKPDNSKISYLGIPNNSKTIILSMEWHPNRRTIDNIERLLGFDYTRRESERRSFILHTLKGNRKFFSDRELNALYYVFCRTTKHREQSYAAIGKTFMSMELRRNLTEQKLYAEPINDMPAPDIPVENRISDSQAERLQNLFSAKNRFKSPVNQSWQAEAYNELTRKPDDDFLEVEYQRQKNEGLI